MNNNFKNKTIILAITPDVEIYKCFVDNLEYLGFEVFLLCNKNKFKYKNILDRLINIVKKTIFNDKSFKRELIRRANLESNIISLNNIEAADYSLTIRADLFDLKVIEKITSIATKNYSYQWDGMNRFPEIKKLVNLFDKFYVFDKKDVNQEINTFPATNFYFDCFKSEFNNSTPEYDVFFIGSYDNRINKLIEICEFLKSYGLRLNIVLSCSPKKNLAKYTYITYINKHLSYFENLKMVNNSKMLIDIQHENLHTGLSFRMFDALGYNKKIITTNKNIKNYDFYNEKNIFLLEDNSDKFESFLKHNYEVINSKIKNKYSFTNWIKYILQQNEFQAINLP